MKLLFVTTKCLLGRIKGELAAAMAGLGTTHSESDVNLMTREHTHSREVISVLCFFTDVFNDLSSTDKMYDNKLC